MSVGTQSWQDISFLVYADEPLLSIKIEQQIVAVNPNIEAQIDAFEVYEEALDYCKQKANVGVIFIHENCGQLDLINTYEQLSRVYKASGWPVIATVIRKANALESIQALKLMRKHPEVLFYVSEGDFENPEFIRSHFEDLWNSYTQLISENLIPSTLKDTFISAIQNRVSECEHVFYDRLSTVLTAPLNLTWKEGFQVRWHNLIHHTYNLKPELLKPHSALTKLVLDPNIDLNSQNQSILQITTNKKGLSTRTIELSKKVVNAANSQQLDQVLIEAKTENRPGRPGLLRTLANRAEQVKDIYLDTYISETAELRKVGNQ